MGTIIDRLKLISSFDHYSVREENGIYYVSDYDNDLEAIYYEKYDNWDYGVIGVVDSECDFKAVDVEALNKLVEVTRKLSGNDE